jgi:hypothetical protein
MRDRAAAAARLMLLRSVFPVHRCECSRLSLSAEETAALLHRRAASATPVEDARPVAVPVHETDAIRILLLRTLPDSLRIGERELRATYSKADVAVLKSAIAKCGYFCRTTAGPRRYAGRLVPGFERRPLDLSRLETLLSAADDSEAAWSRQKQETCATRKRTSCRRVSGQTRPPPRFQLVCWLLFGRSLIEMFCFSMPAGGLRQFR